MGRALRRLILAAIGLVASASGLWADDAADKQSDGRFTGIAIVTSDLNWYDLFSRPETPQIEGVGQLGPGDSGSLVLIFSNAEPQHGQVKIECDVTAFDPKGSSPIVKSEVCYEGPYRGDNILHPALLDLRFQIGDKDPVGQAGFEIALRDVHSGRSVRLSVSFKQGGKS